MSVVARHSTRFRTPDGEISDIQVTTTEHHRIEVTTSQDGSAVRVAVDGVRWGPVE